MVSEERRGPCFCGLAFHDSRSEHRVRCLRRVTRDIGAYIPLLATMKTQSRRADCVCSAKIEPQRRAQERGAVWATP
jgi:hypothetical protein